LNVKIWAHDTVKPRAAQPGRPCSSKARCHDQYSSSVRLVTCTQPRPAPPKTAGSDSCSNCGR
jgi:hypothetical protein